METCGDCCGTGINGHPDSGYTCYTCKGVGGVEVTTVYKKGGLRAEADQDSVSLFIYDDHMITMTTGEFMRIAIALTDADIVSVLPSQDKEYCG